MSGPVEPHASGRRPPAGEPVDWETLLRSEQHAVRRLCAALVDEQSAEDLAQETFSRAVRARASFRGESTPRTWLLAIARHVCLDELRARTRRRRHSVGTAVRRHVPDAAESALVLDLVRRLEPDRRAAFALTQLIGLSYLEAAEVCGCPPGTIRSRVARARADLVAWIAADEVPPAGEAPVG